MTGNRKQSRGKLWDRYTNACKSKTDQKSTKRVKSPLKCESFEQGTTLSQRDSTDEVYIKEMETSRSFLLYNSEKSDAVNLHWEKTTQYRRTYFKTTSGDLSEILQSWPIITKSVGIELVRSFIKKYYILFYAYV